MEGQHPAAGDWGIIGHQRVVGFLQRALESDQLGHAFLITGPPGVGRRTLALALGRTLNCEAGSTAQADLLGGSATVPRPCYACGPCRRLSHGTFVDLLEVNVERDADGKIKQGVSVDQIRELSEQANLAPMDGSYKIFLITEADLLTPSAANALLKTLEEPPPHVVLVLLAPSRDAVQPTLSSRSTHLTLRPVPAPVIEQALIEREGVDPERAAELSQLAGGAPGFALDLVRRADAHQRLEESLDLLRRVLTGDSVDRFQVAETLGKAWADDREYARSVLRRWMTVLEGGLRNRVSPEGSGKRSDLNGLVSGLMLSSVASILKALRAVHESVDHMQPRVAFEVLMLDVEAALRQSGSAAATRH
jgi:DNA polymerase-3 subunit delta'